MKKLKNEDGTYNIYDRYHTDENGEDFGYRVVSKDWLDCVNLKGAISVDLWIDGTLRIVYHNYYTVWYENVFGTWGRPKTFG